MPAKTNHNLVDDHRRRAEEAERVSGRLILAIVLLAVAAAFLIGIAIAALGPSGVGDSNSALSAPFALLG